MSYPAPYFAQIHDLYNRFGPENINRQADMDGSGNATNIANRINDALMNADASVYGALRLSKYSHLLPAIVDRNGNIPRELVWCAARIAGYDLLCPRGFRDYDKEGRPLNHLQRDLEMAEAMLDKIAEQKLFMMDVEA